MLRLLQLAEKEKDSYSEDDLLSLCTNRVQVEDALRNPIHCFRGPNGPVLAAIRIQTVWRRFKAYSAFVQLKYLMTKATVI